MAHVERDCLNLAPMRLSALFWPFSAPSFAEKFLNVSKSHCGGNARCLFSDEIRCAPFAILRVYRRVERCPLSVGPQTDGRDHSDRNSEDNADQHRVFKEGSSIPVIVEVAADVSDLSHGENFLPVTRLLFISCLARIIARVGSPLALRWCLPNFQPRSALPRNPENFNEASG